MRRTAIRLVTWLAIPAAALCGCGGSSDSGSTDSTAAAAAGPTPVETCVQHWNAAAAATPAGRTTAEEALSIGRKGNAAPLVNAEFSIASPGRCLVTIANVLDGVAGQWQENAPQTFEHTQRFTNFYDLPPNSRKWNAHEATRTTLAVGAPTEGHQHATESGPTGALSSSSGSGG